MTRHSFAALFAAALFLSAGGYAAAEKGAAKKPAPDKVAPDKGDKAGDKTAPTEAKVAPADKKWVEETMQWNKAEIALGQLAQEKSQTDSVKQFGQQMVEHHTALNEKLSQVATAMGATVPEAVSKKQQAQHDKLAKQEGKKFDKAYMAAMVTEHQAAVKKYEKAVKSKNEQIKTYAEAALPQVKEHLAKAKEVQTSLKGVATK
jgi:putative membrane protein